MVSLDIKLATKILGMLKIRYKGFPKVTMIDPFLYLTGFCEKHDFVDEGSCHYVDVNYFLDGMIREDGGKNPPRISDPFVDLYDFPPTFFRFEKIISNGIKIIGSYGFGEERYNAHRRPKKVR